MLKNLTTLTHKIGDKIYTLMCDMDSPLSEVKEALFKFVGHVAKIEEHVAAQNPPAAPVESIAPVEPIVPPVEPPAV